MMMWTNANMLEVMWHMTMHGDLAHDVDGEQLMTGKPRGG